MKFGHSFTQALEDDFPAEWQTAAIRYRQLKKCIKKVQRELMDLGLSVEILKSLVDHSDEGSELTKHGPIFHYMFDGTLQSFQPKLVLTVDSTQGIPLDLNLSEETKEAIEKLVRRKSCLQPNDSSRGTESEEGSENGGDSHSISTDSSDRSSSDADDEESGVATIKVPLYSDHEFFQILTSELASLDALQTRAESDIKQDVKKLGSAVTTVATPKSFSSRSDLYPWREIFRIYMESGVFFSNLEIEAHRERSVEKAQERLNWFTTEIDRLKLRSTFKSPGSAFLFARFMEVNKSILKLLKFQEMNKMAMTKILKKFDKRTALGARQTFPVFIASNPFIASHMAKAICYTMSSNLLNIIPQLDDYLCPICSSIFVKPIRLACSHIFCVRCLVKLQRDNKRFCPMCRSDVVMIADSANLDMSLLRFLKDYFPKEAKEKQLENEREVAMEQWHSIHDSKECIIM
ncbi:hypothetical protein RUND412_000995 [Rhizina undulata]